MLAVEANPAVLGLAARGAIENPAFFPPEPTDRNLAEGYRYLLGHLARIIEAQTQRDPDFPYFQRSVRMLSKWTIDNPDTMYLSATIDAEGIYRIRGRALDTTEWRTGERGRIGERAPRVASPALQPWGGVTPLTCGMRRGTHLLPTSVSVRV